MTYVSVRTLKVRKENKSEILVTEPDDKCTSAHAQSAEGKQISNNVSVRTLKVRKGNKSVILVTEPDDKYTSAHAQGTNSPLILKGFPLTLSLTLSPRGQNAQPLAPHGLVQH
jgi:hypothetical protein